MKLLLRIFRYLPFSWKFKLVDFLLKRKGIEIKIAKTPEELEKVYRLRYEVYKDEDYIDQKDYPDGRLTDKYDEHSIIFLAMKNGEAVGTVRLIFYSEKGFSLEHAFNILNFPYPPQKTADLSKLCVKKEFRGGIISLGLLKMALEVSQEKNIKCWLFGTTKKIKDYFEEKIGIVCNNLSTGSLTPENLKERNLAAKRYFQKAQINPYYVDLKKQNLIWRFF